LTFISNDILNFQDESGVLPTRLINNQFDVSFLNREDVELKDKLEAELPGIANRCLAAYRRLMARGRFVQPESGLGLQQKIKAKVNDYTAFIEEHCVVEEGAMVPVSDLRWRFETWCGSTGRLNTLKATPKNLLKGKLSDALGWEIRTIKPHGDKRHYVGLRLKDGNELEGDEG
jgi:phage/plasmid-associated DNA primase